MERFRPRFGDESDDDDVESLELQLSIFDDSPQSPSRETLTVRGKADDSHKRGSQSSDDFTGDLIVLGEARLDVDSDSDAQDPPEGRGRLADTRARQDDPEEARTFKADGRPLPRAIVSQDPASPLEMINCKPDALAHPSDDLNVARDAPNVAIARPTKKSRAMVVSMNQMPNTVTP